jgi:signal transduction histidine kinase/DNA-binding response OmpR family regulator
MKAERLFDVPGEMAALMATMDWSKTALGPVSEWSEALRSAVGLLLRNRFPLLLWWGPRFVQLYNDAYRPIPGDKHPRSLGQEGSACWSEIWHIIGPMAEAPFSGQPATTSDDLSLLIDRRGFLEETHFKVAYSPVPDDTVEPTGVGGVIATVAETTEQVYAERQLRTLRELGARAAEAHEPEDAFEIGATTLTENPADVPFALFYIYEPESRELRLVRSCGFEEVDGPANPSLIRLDEQSRSAGWPLRSVVERRAIEVFDDIRTRYANLPTGSWSEPPRTAIALPLAAPEQPHVYGVLVVGVSPHRALDESYRGFCELAAGQIANAIRNARAYQEERARATKLSLLDRAKTAFFSNVSHEFRTPLTLMLGPMEDALAASSRVLSGEGLETAYRNALRLLKLVNTLLDFSRIEAGRTEASFEPTDLTRFTAELASVFRSAIDRAGLRLLLRCDPLPAPVYVDREMWEKIVLNLLSNAFKFTFEGEIEVALRAVGNHAELGVRDTGVGISAQDLPRIFERFHRIEGVKARTYEGSGIGLALVQELVRMHGGEITAHSEVGKGTTLTVRLPFGSSHLPHERIAAKKTHVSTATRSVAFVEEALRWLPEQEESTRLEAPRASPDLDGARILLADDNADMRDYVVRLLRPRWFVEAVPDGDAALAAVRRRKFDLVITDVMMPRLDGFGLLRELRRDPATRALPVIMLSARAGEESRVEGLEAGADDYVVKPFSARELLARVATRLEILRLGSRLEQERAAVANLFHQTPLPVAILRGEDLVFEVANPACIEVAGERELLGKPILEALPELRGQGFDDQMRDVMRTGLTQVGREVLVRLRRHDVIEDTYFTFIFAPLGTIGGRSDSVVVICNEVTEQVQARIKLEALAAQADAANRAKDEFLAMLGHELRNPLSPILTSLQLMRLKGQHSREQDILERQVRHLTRLVDDLLDVSRITRGKIELQKQRIPLADIVARAIETANPLLELRQHRLVVDVPRSSLEVDADPDRMAQVVANLLTNASKYSDVGSEIRIFAQSQDGVVRLSVKDRGIGIAADMLDHVFDLFVQHPQTLERSRGGLGLGLTIVRNLVEQHGGTVVAKSAGPGKGSEFVIELPAAGLPSPTASVRETGKVAGNGEPRPKRILVVDDNGDAAAILADVLELLGNTVAIAHDGPSALETARSFSPDLALVDIGLPVMDGYELARRLRDQQGISSHLRLVAVTGYGQEADRRRSADAGFEDHLVKPVDMAVLENVVKRSPAASAPP